MTLQPPLLPASVALVPAAPWLIPDVAPQLRAEQPELVAAVSDTVAWMLWRSTHIELVVATSRGVVAGGVLERAGLPDGYWLRHPYRRSGAPDPVAEPDPASPPPDPADPAAAGWWVARALLDAAADSAAAEGEPGVECGSTAAGGAGATAAVTAATPAGGMAARSAGEPAAANSAAPSPAGAGVPATSGTVMTVSRGADAGAGSGGVPTSPVPTTGVPTSPVPTPHSPRARGLLVLADGALTHPGGPLAPAPEQQQELAEAAADAAQCELRWQREALDDDPGRPPDEPTRHPQDTRGASLPAALRALARRRDAGEKWYAAGGFLGAPYGVGYHVYRWWQ